MLDYHGILCRNGLRRFERIDLEHKDAADGGGRIFKRTRGSQKAVPRHPLNVGHVGGLDAFAILRERLARRVRGAYRLRAQDEQGREDSSYAPPVEKYTSTRLCFSPAGIYFTVGGAILLLPFSALPQFPTRLRGER